MTEMPLPPMIEAILGPSEIERLFDELTTHADVTAVLLKAGPRDHAAAEQPSLDGALQRILSGTVRAAQIRYVYDGADWTDTLLTTSAGVRLVRCRHDQLS